MRVAFIQTTMIVGGAETLLVNLIRRLDRTRFQPELVCLKDRGPLGDLLADEVPVHANLLSGKHDLRVLPRLARLLRKRKIDAVVTVGAGDKMFWGRLAAKRAGVPVIAAALHSTGWPDVVGRLNRMLTPWTDAFIGCAPSHGRFLVEQERFPAAKVFVIPNGVDTQRFAPPVDRAAIRAELGLHPTAPVVGILAALRPEKNHEMFLHVAALVRRQLRDARFLVIGDGPRRAELEALAQELGLADYVCFLGNRDDVPRVIGATDVMTLTSRIEASPVSILEAMAVGRPVVATRVGSVAETVTEGQTGCLVDSDDQAAMVDRVAELLCDPLRAEAYGRAGRTWVVQQRSLSVMVEGYEELLEDLYQRKSSRRPMRQPAGAPGDLATLDLRAPALLVHPAES
ncbi:GDP-mannose-dependent alpha-(1-6)-phosphatidylinositol monomannoside mannosyltransferase [Pirellulimonas nuda]|uniref:GDP-mannose-dependent alpha-(1-6)-phosphatidylinositol monomannoside mannosyltransferase n=1 Tax=Pirellulimonas nuda TaxID=2528009 RepID=A0A518D7I9_9BACT|nr:glycosyltransferase [Pirellulimonas nuda]QDU87440.1 GDP-mannose-dependent alpha-(1-6)-phosphatidylinositol monomannoside mannosyltransferase [Pirellulimonas nuda]